MALIVQNFPFWKFGQKVVDIWRNWQLIHDHWVLNMQLVDHAAFNLGKCFVSTAILKHVVINFFKLFLSLKKSKFLSLNSRIRL